MHFSNLVTGFPKYGIPLFFLFVLFLTQGCSLSNKDEVEILFRMAGSNTIGAKAAPQLVKAFLEKEFNTQNTQIIKISPTDDLVQGVKDGKKVGVRIYAHGTSTGFDSLIHERTDIVMASRRVREKEFSALKVKGNMRGSRCEHLIASDGIAVIVHPDNPLSEIDKKSLSDLFSGKMTTWKNLTEENNTVNIYARDDFSGTFSAYKSRVLSPYESKLTKLAHRFESNNGLIRAIEEDPYGIGFVGAASVTAKVKVLKVRERGSPYLFAPESFDISTGDYALSRELFLYTVADPPSSVDQFIRFTASEDAVKILGKLGMSGSEPKTAVNEGSKLCTESESPEIKKYCTFTESARRMSLTFKWNEKTGALTTKSLQQAKRLIEQFEKGKKLKLVIFTENAQAHKALSEAESQALKLREFFKSKNINIDPLPMGSVLPLADAVNQLGRERNKRIEVWVE